MQHPLNDRAALFLLTIIAGGYNFAYEDYRWEAVRKRINNEFLYQLLNFFIIAFYQNLLLWLLVLPMFAVIAEGQNVPFGWRDAAGNDALVITVETC